jgi:hypothetical protein
MGAQGARPDLATRLDPGRGHPRDRLPFNEEYIRDKDGRLENPGFLDYRVPVASDLPMIEAVMVENANPRHPFGARGVGEVHTQLADIAASAARRDQLAGTGAEGGRIAMPRVHFSGQAARRFTGGQTELEVEATNFRRMVLELDRRFPGLGRQIEESIAVAIDGETFQDTYLAPLNPDRAIYLIPKIGGG